MGWIVSLILLVAAMRSGNEIILIAAGLFAIAGAIAWQSFK